MAVSNVLEAGGGGGVAEQACQQMYSPFSAFWMDFFQTSLHGQSFSLMKIIFFREGGIPTTFHWPMPDFYWSIKVISYYSMLTALTSVLKHKNTCCSYQQNKGQLVKCIVTFAIASLDISGFHSCANCSC